MMSRKLGIGIGVAIGINIEMSTDSDLDHESDSDTDPDGHEHLRQILFMRLGAPPVHSGSQIAQDVNPVLILTDA